MKFLLSILLLVGLLPGASLPAFLTDQLIVPVRNLSESAPNESEPGSTSQEKNGSPAEDEGSSILVVPPSYTATKPARLALSKADMSQVRTCHQSFYASVCLQAGLMLADNNRPATSTGVLDLNACIAHQPPCTSAPIRSHAPPAIL